LNEVEVNLLKDSEEVVSTYTDEIPPPICDEDLAEMSEVAQPDKSDVIPAPAEEENLIVPPPPPPPVCDGCDLPSPSKDVLTEDYQADSEDVQTVTIAFSDEDCSPDEPPKELALAIHEVVSETDTDEVVCPVPPPPAECLSGASVSDSVSVPTIAAVFDSRSAPQVFSLVVTSCTLGMALCFILFISSSALCALYLLLSPCMAAENIPSDVSFGHHVYVCLGMRSLGTVFFLYSAPFYLNAKSRN
jgi:hypothetical protein